MALDEDENGYGPAMQALPQRRRDFVRLYLDNPLLSDREVARRAGYSDPGGGSSAIRVRAHELLHDERVLAAIREEVGKRFRRQAALGLHVVSKIAMSDGHPQQLKAAEALLNRGGFAVEQHIKVEHRDMGGEAVIESIKRLALELGMPADKLLGGNTPKLIEGTVSREPNG